MIDVIRGYFEKKGSFASTMGEIYCNVMKKIALVAIFFTKHPAQSLRRT